MGEHVVYMLKCGDESYYTGYTTDLGRRIDEHRSGSGAKYTRGRGPLRVVHREAFDTQSAALQREAAIKELSHEQKACLVDAGESRPA